MAKVYAGSGDWQQLVSTVATIFGGARFVLLAEAASALKRPTFDYETALKPGAVLPRGRAFDAERELRWREAERGEFVISFLSETLSPPAACGLQDTGSEYQAQRSKQKLYGQWNGKDWLEVSVPGIAGVYQGLSLSAASLMLKVFHYRQDGVVLMTRFVSVEPFV